MPRHIDRLARCLKPHAHVQVMVPSVTRSHRPLPSQRFRTRIENSLLEVATGATTYEGVGVWRNGRARPVHERVLVVESYLPRRVSTIASRRVAQSLSGVAQDADQDALLVVIDGRPFLLPGTRRSRKRRI